MTTITITVKSLKEMDRAIQSLIDSRFENLGSWEFYKRKLDIKVILKVKLGF